MNATWHPDADLLADVEADLADDAAVSRVEAHLAECADCRALRERLATVTVALGSQPAPRMPEEVSSRVLAALAAEPQPVAGAAVVALEQARPTRWRRLRQGLAAAAAVAAIVGVGAVGVTVFRETRVEMTAGDDAASGTAGELSSGAPPAAPGVGAPEAAFMSATGRAYTPDNLAAAAAELATRAALLANNRPAPSRQAPDAAAGADETTLGRLRNPAVLAACVNGLTGGREVAPVAVDFATYQGRPAAIIVVPAAAANVLDVFVVGPDCSAAESDLIDSTSVQR
jgi:hypothetical protein